MSEKHQVKLRGKIVATDITLEGKPCSLVILDGVGGGGGFSIDGKLPDGSEVTVLVAVTVK